MNLMTDKEVGELWLELWQVYEEGRIYEHSSFEEDREVKLIRKLVKEHRSKRHAEQWLNWIVNGKQGPSPSMMLDDGEALRDFGIPEDQWIAPKT